MNNTQELTRWCKLQMAFHRWLDDDGAYTGNRNSD